MPRAAQRSEAAPRSRRFRGRHARQVESRAKVLEEKLARLLAEQARELLDEAIRGLSKRNPTRVQKALSARERKILTLLTHYGLMQVRDGGDSIGAPEGRPRRRFPGSRGGRTGRFTLTPRFEARFLAQNKILVQELTANIREAFRAGMQRAMADWSTEDPPPPLKEIARRLRVGQVVAPDKWSDRDQGFLKPLSTSTSIHGLASRARTIARTEIGRARNAGRVEGMRLAGFTHHKWSSYSDDHSRKGHSKMNGQVRRIGEPFDNPETGHEIKFPGDPEAPASETINCRCTVVPTIKKS